MWRSTNYAKSHQNYHFTLQYFTGSCKAITTPQTQSSPVYFVKLLEPKRRKLICSNNRLMCSQAKRNILQTNFRNSVSRWSRTEPATPHATGVIDCSRAGPESWRFRQPDTDSPRQRQPGRIRQSSVRSRDDCSMLLGEFKSRNCNKQADNRIFQNCKRFFVWITNLWVFTIA